MLHPVLERIIGIIDDVVVYCIRSDGSLGPIVFPPRTVFRSDVFPLITNFVIILVIKRNDYDSVFERQQFKRYSVKSKYRPINPLSLAIMVVLCAMYRFHQYLFGVPGHLLPAYGHSGGCLPITRIYFRCRSFVR